MSSMMRRRLASAYDPQDTLRRQSGQAMAGDELAEQD
jgi:hypothetical protein